MRSLLASPGTRGDALSAVWEEGLPAATMVAWDGMERCDRETVHGHCDIVGGNIEWGLGNILLTGGRMSFHNEPTHKRRASLWYVSSHVSVRAPHA